MKYILLALALAGCDEVPEQYTVIHEVEAPIIDQCADHGEYSEVNIILYLLICRDGWTYDLTPKQD